MELEFDLKPALSEVKRRKARTVAIQVPEGLKQRAWEIALEIEKGAGANAIVFTDPCFGACDTAWQRAKLLGADLLLHFGHAEMIKGGKRTVYVPLKYKVSKSKIEIAAKKFAGIAKDAKISKVALCATIQYAHILKPLAKTLESYGIKALIGRGGARIAVPGQVLGCNFSAVRSVEGRAEGVLFVGDGEFHPLGISYVSRKPLFVLNPAEASVARFSDRDRFIRKRYAAVARAKGAKNFAVVASTKAGQLNMSAAWRAKRMLESAGKKAVLMACDFVRPEYFEGMGIEAIVSTACPRIAIDDAGLFRQPVISVPELEIMLEKRKLGDYKIA